MMLTDVPFDHVQITHDERMECPAGLVAGQTIIVEFHDTTGVRHKITFDESCFAFGKDARREIVTRPGRIYYLACEVMEPKFIPCVVIEQ